MAWTLSCLFVWGASRNRFPYLINVLIPVWSIGHGILLNLIQRNVPIFGLELDIHSPVFEGFQLQMFVLGCLAASSNWLVVVLLCSPISLTSDTLFLLARSQMTLDSADEASAAI